MGLWRKLGAVVVVGVALAAGWWAGRPAAGRAPVIAAPAGSACQVTTTMEDARHPGMVWIAGGSFSAGSDSGFPEEGPAVAVQVEGFFMDRTEVTNAQFAAFVAATGYRTLAERVTPAGSAVFKAQQVSAALGAPANWWRFMPGADWRHPEGPGSSLNGREQHPVVHVAREDAQAYAQWMGRSLPTEWQFEYAARGSARRDAEGHHQANTWQGQFPARNDAADGHAGTAPVGCYAPNAQGLHDLLGNVWEWTGSAYYARHDQQDDSVHPQGFDPAQPDEPAVAVLKGGSFLCAPDYCMRYRPEARIAQAPGSSTAHLGFRTVLNP